MDYETLTTNVRKQIKERRTNRNMTFGQLSIKIGAAPTIIWQWEIGRHLPSAWYLVKLSEVFECSVDELLGR